MATDHFATLGLPRTFAIDEDRLERTYLARSRELHPDHQADALPERRQELLESSAALNNAYKVLRAPFRRAEHLAELTDPGVMEREKRLPPEFLAEAMEVAERVVDCPPAEAAALAQELRSHIADYLARIASVFGGRDPRVAATGAARLLHRSRYDRKALKDLTERR